MPAKLQWCSETEYIETKNKVIGMSLLELTVPRKQNVNYIKSKLVMKIHIYFIQSRCPLRERMKCATRETFTQHCY